MLNTTSNPISELTATLGAIGLAVLVVVGTVAIVAVFAYMFLQWWKHRNREAYALDFVTLQIRLPRDTEVKVDAAEQMFSGLYSLKKPGMFANWFGTEDYFAFEIVALKESIAFYVSCPRKIRDLVEKQINGAYPSADMKEVDEVNIFSEKGKVAFTTLTHESSYFKPIKTFKDLPTDGLSLLTSAFSKMGTGEGAILQIMLQPIDPGWKKKGRNFMSTEKKREADPEKASYSHDPKEMEAISTKLEKPGFRVVMRAVVSAQNEDTAEMHLNNIVGAFAQFSSAYNAFQRGTIFIKHLFMIDFLYRYMPLFNRNTMILNTEELATVFHKRQHLIDVLGVSHDAHELDERRAFFIHDR